jgi:signal transduction histidine kinase
MIPLKEWFARKTKYPLMLLIFIMVLFEIIYLFQWNQNFQSNINENVRNLNQLTNLAIVQKNRGMIETLFNYTLNDLNATKIALCQNNQALISYPGGPANCQPAHNRLFDETIVTPIMGMEEYSLHISINNTDKLKPWAYLFFINLFMLLGVLYIVMKVQRSIKNDIINVISKDLSTQNKLNIEELNTIKLDLENLTTLKAREQAVLQIQNNSAQVAHDIKSPLAALAIASSDLSKLDEDHRVLIRTAVNRIQDIANDLANQNKQVKKVKEDIYLLSSLVNNIISEKRTQFSTKKDLILELNIGTAAYGLFAKIQPKEFKRLLSNIINNAAEAVETKAIITVTVDTVSESIFIKIQDNGKGIPKHIIPQLMTKGVSHGKKGGQGLGLYHALQNIKSWGGSLKITSEESSGTCVTITLPMQASPSWFVPQINIEQTKQTLPMIVILDDDDSIHKIWDNRFKANHFPIENIIHFKNPNDVIRYVNKTENITSMNYIYLFDYELLGCSLNGIDVIRELGIAKQAILVTSHYEEEAIRNSCLELGLKLLPKNLAGFVPICIRSVEPQIRRTVVKDDVVTQTKPEEGIEQFPTAEQRNRGTEDPNIDAILIDDDYLVHTSWKIIAKKCGKNINCYADPEDFMVDSNNIDKLTPLYIDSNLGIDVKGEIIAKEIHNKGFKRIYLATGSSPEEFPSMPWIEKIVSKNAPFLDKNWK